MTREQLTQQILEAKRAKRLSFAAIADALERDRVWTTAALLGQHPFDAESADTLVELLELSGDADASAVLQEVPTRGSFDQLPRRTRRSTASTRRSRSTARRSRP